MAYPAIFLFNSDNEIRLQRHIHLPQLLLPSFVGVAQPEISTFKP